MTRIQIFCSEDAYPYEITGKRRNESPDKNVYADKNSGKTSNTASVADVLKDPRVLAEFLVLNQDRTMPCPWMDAYYSKHYVNPTKNHQDSLSKEELYKELFLPTEIEIEICLRWLRSNSESDRTIKEIRDRCL